MLPKAGIPLHDSFNGLYLSFYFSTTKDNKFLAYMYLIVYKGYVQCVNNLMDC